MKCGVKQRKMRTIMVRALSFSAIAALILNPALAPVVASDYRVATLIASAYMAFVVCSSKNKPTV